MFLPNDLRLTQNILLEPLNSSTVCPKCMSTPFFPRRSSEYCTQCTQDSQKHNTFLPTYLFVHSFVFLLLFYVVSSFCLLCATLACHIQSSVLNTEEQSCHDHRCSSPCEAFSMSGAWHNEVVVLLMQQGICDVTGLLWSWKRVNVERSW